MTPRLVAALALLAACIPPAQQQQPGPGGGGGASADLCDRACASYARCRGLDDPSFVPSCAAECSASAPDPAVIEQAASGDCPTVIALFEGQAGAPAGEAAGYAPGNAGPGDGGQAYAGGPAYGGAAPAGAACQAPRGNGGQDAQLIQLLTSSAWCHFSYNGATTKNERVVLSADGRLALAGNSETSRSGDLRNQYGEQTATYGAGSQSNSGERGCWKVENSALYISLDGATWANANASLSQNSNGSPIVTANGKEYGRCN
jgi:hypothetical protein